MTRIIARGRRGLFLIFALSVTAPAAGSPPLELGKIERVSSSEAVATPLWTADNGWTFGPQPPSAKELLGSRDGRAASLLWQTSQPARGFVSIEPIERDWSGYKALRLVVSSDEATGARINVQASGDGEGYYLADFEVDWRGRKTLDLDLTRDFRGFHSPRGWGDVEKLMLSSRGWGVTPKRGTVLRLEDVQLVHVPKAGADLDWAEACRVWDAPNFDHRDYSGATFYVHHDQGRQALVRIGFTTAATHADGLPPNLDLRVFGPNDRCVMRVDLSKTPGTYATSVSLADQPTGRFRFAFTGEHEGLTVASEPAQAIGVAGGYALGLPGEASAHFVNVPEGVRRWALWVSAAETGQVVKVFDDRGREAGRLEAPVTYRRWGKLAFENVRGGGVWRIEHEGGKRLRLFTRGLPGVLWPDQASAERHGPDVTYVAGRRVNHRWQEPLARWLAGQPEGGFDLPPWPDRPPGPDHLDDQQAIRAAPLFGIYGPLNQGPELARHQLIRPGSPNHGLFFDDPRLAPQRAFNADYHAPALDARYAYTMAWMWRSEPRGLNPFHADPGLLNRLIAAYCQAMLAISESQALFTENQIERDAADASSFLTLAAYPKLYAALEAELEPELAESFRAGLTELYHRYAYYQSYATNQWSHLIVGASAAADIVDDARIAAAAHRQIDRLIHDASGSATRGQTIEGFYREEGGIDGHYSSMSEYYLGLLWHKTRDPRLLESLRRAYQLKRHLIVTCPQLGFVSARNWNHRTDSDLTRGYPAARLMANTLPNASAIMHRIEPSTHLTWYVRDAVTARRAISDWWGKTSDADRLGVRQAAAGVVGGELAHLAVPPFLKPNAFACEEDWAGIRRFGSQFAVARLDPWYIVLYSGGDRPAHAPPGNGLATLWHRHLGPLLLGDTEINRSSVDAAFPLVATDRGTIAGRAFSTHQRPVRLAADARGDRMSAAIELDEGISLERSYVVADAVLRSEARWTGGKPSRHMLVLPVVTNPHLSVEARSRNSAPVPLTQGKAVQIESIAWHRGEAAVELRFDSPVPMRVLGTEKMDALEITLCEFDISATDGGWRFREVNASAGPHAP